MKKYKYTKAFTYNKHRYYVRANTLEEIGEKKANKIASLKANEKKESNITVEEWTMKCIEVYKTNQAEITRKKYVSRIKHCILKHIGEMRIKDVTPIHCQEVLNLQANNSKAQINEVYQALRFIFSHAVFNDIIHKNPTLTLKKPKGTYNPRRALTTFERTCLVDVAEKDRKYYWALLMLYCGCRPMEACEVKGSDLYILGKQPILHIRGTKTKNADREVPIPFELWEIIKDTPKREYVSLYGNGNKITPDNRGRLWKSLWREMNIYAGTETYRNKLVEPYLIPKDLTPYCLRHEFCSDLAKRGIDIRIAQKLMGHSDISLTANIYTHVDTAQMVSALSYKPSKGATLGATPKKVKLGQKGHSEKEEEKKKNR